MDIVFKAARDIWEKLKKIWEKLQGIDVKEKSIFALLFVGIVVALLPMLIIAKYNVPCADDYSYGRDAHLAWNQSHSLLDVLNASVQGVKTTYFRWQGTYSAVFAFSLQPAVFGEKWYSLTTYIMLISLCGGIACLVTAVFHGTLKATWYQTGIVTIVLLAICTQLVPSPVEGFYWYNGSVLYTFFFGISLILYAKVLTYIRLSATALSPVKGILRLFSLSVLSAIVAGANYVTALITAVLFACVLAFLIVQKKRSCMGFVVPFCVFFVGFFVNILAPGNSLRQAAVVHHPSALLSILLSFCAAAYYALDWLTPVLVILVIFLIPLLYKIAAKTSYSYSYPVLVLLGSFCLFAAMFCPPIYAEGDRGPDRLLDIIYYAFVILLVFDLFYILGWYRRRAEARGTCIKAGDPGSECERSAYSGAIFSAVALLLAVILSGSVLGGSYYTSGNALLDLVRGNASAYYDTAMERVDILTDDSQQDVVLPRYPVKPRVLYRIDIETDPSHWRNMNMSDYYQKNSVALEPGEE